MKKNAFDIYLKKGDIIRFGEYCQSDDSENGAVPLEWQILEVDDDRALLLSLYGIDAKPYHSIQENISWENCSIRKWLNEDFFKRAFRAEDKEIICCTKIQNRANPEWGPLGGRDTLDKIFLLSYEEVYEYLKKKFERVGIATPYAKMRGAVSSGVLGRRDEAEGLEEIRSCVKKVDGSHVEWWLRNPGRQNSYAMAVQSDGSVRSYGFLVNHRSLLVRPALYISLKSEIVS